MDRGSALVLTLVVGGLIALQAPINSGLGRATGTVQAAFISFVTGTVLLAMILVLSGGFSPLKEASGVGWLYLTGGLLGVAYVTVALLTVRTLGAGGITAATITGQLTAAVIIDRLGVLGLEEVQVTWTRVMGVALLLVGTLLIVKD